GCLSFHATKNFAAGEGGALITRDPEAGRQARIFREKGTNRDDFTAGLVDHYAWVGLGSSIVMPELSAAIARVQLTKFDRILDARQRLARLYDEQLHDLDRERRIRIVRPVGDGVSSRHIYAVLVDPAIRAAVVGRMASSGIQVASHFVPLHASPFGRTLAPGLTLPRTDQLAASLIRLPIYPGLADEDVRTVVAALRRALGG
ncbi:MAG: DegT/DnrJ/EryC1/StrS family aminotransferase, partial [Vicinamibacterales bacterium]